MSGTYLVSSYMDKDSVKCWVPAETQRASSGMSRQASRSRRSPNGFPPAAMRLHPLPPR